MNINKHSPDWRALSEWLTERIEKLKNDLTQNQDESSTTQIRARIRAFKDVLKLGDDPTKEEA